jgi:bacillithiol synthase
LHIIKMEFSATYIPYTATGAFSTIVTDYLSGAGALRPFYGHRPDLPGIEAAIAQRQGFATDRSLLAAQLELQYADMPAATAVAHNIRLLRNENCFTICTAHQPNVFTGPLYFVYKIIHAIKLAGHLQNALPQYNFVPVYYMGSEDADLEELGEVWVDGTPYRWQTGQTGAVGRMTVDDALLQLLQQMAGQLLVLPYGADIVQLLQQCYTKGSTIEQATFRLVHALFAQYGLVVLLPDRAPLKRALLPIFKDDLLHHRAEAIVTATSAKLAEQYKAQAYPRPINLFYLGDGIRERIEKTATGYQVLQTDIVFTEAALLAELEAHPERFSPNVILRGLYQETILPNVAFVGGGGELAYWLQLKDLFDHYGVPYPVQVLRNSFLVLPPDIVQKAAQMGLGDSDFFADEQALLNGLVRKEHATALSLETEQAELFAYYQQLGQKAAAVDPTLQKHVAALQTKALQKVAALEKKMLRAKKRSYAVQARQIQAIRSAVFPSNRLQERAEGLLAPYARYGKPFMDGLFRVSPDLQQVFTLLKKNI